MKSTGSACSLLLLTMAAVSSGRNAREYFAEAPFQNSPSRPEDALVFFIADAPPLICEPMKSDLPIREDRPEVDYFVNLPRSYTPYICTFEGNTTTDTNSRLMDDILGNSYTIIAGRQIRYFNQNNIYCFASSQLPDEYFDMRIQRPHEDRILKCLLKKKKKSTLYVRFRGYPTIVCQLVTDEGTFRFNLPGIDDSLKCAFRVYSELPLSDTHTEERLYQSLISSLPSRVNSARPRVVCSRHATSNRTAHFQLQLEGGDTYDCSFPDAVPPYLPQTVMSPQE